MFEQKFNRFCDKVVTVIKGFTGILLLAMLLVVVFQVFWRGVLKLPTPWTEEASTYLVTYITFIGGIAVMIRGEHLTIDLVTEHVSEKMRAWFQVIYCAVFLFVCGYLAFYGAQLCLSPLIYKSRSIAMQIPKVIVYAVMPFSMGLSVIYNVFHLYFLIKHIVTDGKKTDQVAAENAAA